jgi:Ca2+-transporting ATPase
MQTLLCKQWHCSNKEDVARLVNTDLKKGLSIIEVNRRQKHFGPNQITIHKKHGPIFKFFLQFHQPLIYTLLAATIVTLFLQEWVDAIVIFGVIIVNAIIGFLQEFKAEKAIESLQEMITTNTSVIRDNKKIEVPSHELVPGDIVVLNAGDKVPADMRLFSIQDLQIDESALTGESLPIRKKEHQIDQNTVLADRINMGYSGTLVRTGEAKGVVVATADETETGKISHLISEATELSTPLTKKIAYFSKLLLYVIVALALVTFIVGIFRGNSIFEMFMAAVALAVGAIPEGLPAAVTITLALGVKRMAARRAIMT